MPALGGGRSAGIKARKRKHDEEKALSAEEAETEDAAVKIQAVFRGKQERKRLAHRQAEQKMTQQTNVQEAILDQLEQEQKEEQQDKSKQSGEADKVKEDAEDENPDERGSKEIAVPMSTRYRIYLILEDPTSSKQAQITSVVILTTILFSIACFMVETMPDFKNVSADTWLAMELICTVVFTLEYVIRFCVCDVVGVSQWKFVRDPMNVCDFLAILPFYVQQIGKAAGAEDMGIIRAFRLSRLLRIFKLARYSSGMRLMAEALTNSFRALSVLLFFLCIGIVLFSSSLYNVERISCPSRKELAKTPGETEKYIQECLKSGDGWSQNYGLCCDEHDSPNDFPSIMEAFWWSIVTMTTVGFGDVYPRTVGGRIVGIFTMLAGLLLISLPVAIVGRKFQEVYEDHFNSDAQAASENRHHHVAKETMSDDGSQMKEMARKVRKMKVTTRDGKVNFDTQIQELADLFDTAETMARAAHIKQVADVNREIDILELFEEFVDDYKSSLLNQRDKMRAGGDS